MRWPEIGVLAACVASVLVVASCEENPADVAVVVTEAPCDTVFVIERVPCVWRRHVGWVCLDAPLPDEPKETERRDSDA